MNNRVNCQIIDILLNANNEFTNKYASFSKGSFDYDNVIEDYFKSKNMCSIKIDKGNQSICFTNQKEPISIYNQTIKRNEQYFEEIHLHCNDLYHFDKFVDYLFHSEFSKTVEEVKVLPHYDSIVGDFRNYELVSEPMTNEVAATKNLVNILSQRSDEAIFRALAIHFCKLVDKTNDINIDLIHNLNDIYKKRVENSATLFFSDEVSNQLLNILSEENNMENKIADIPSHNMVLNDSYSVYIEDGEIGIERE